MMTTNQNTLNASRSLLTTLRHIGHAPASSMEGMRRNTEAQACALREAFLGPAHHLPDYLSRMFPTIRVEHVTDLPVAGISYWAGHHWHIHVRSTDAPEERTFTVLHQLKHIIDRPLRRRSPQFSDQDWESLANYFAHQVLTPSRAPLLT